MGDIFVELNKLGYVPNYIFDIGAHKGAWTSCMRSVYPDARYFLFEASEYPHLDDVKNVVLFKNCILNEKVEEVDWFGINTTGDSFFRENTKHYMNISPVKRTTVTLDSIDIGCEIKDKLLIKIDCQGAEIPILKGSKKYYESADFILLELPFFGSYNSGTPKFLDHISFMDEIGFIPFDIAEVHKIFGFKMQIDILFIRKTHEFNKRVQEMLLLL